MYQLFLLILIFWLIIKESNFLDDGYTSRYGVIMAGKGQDQFYGWSLN